MFTSTSHIRKFVINKSDGGIPDDLRRKIHDTHRFVFLIIGMSIYPNTDSSLLTQKLFRCENFANDCMLYHNICLTILALTFSVLPQRADFKNLMYSVWAALLCHIFHVLIGFFGNGKHARNLFILVFAIMGCLRAGLAFSCPLVISKLFYISAFVLLNNSRSGCALILGFFQTVLNNLIGFNTIFEARLNLILCHSFQALITLIGAIWITILFIYYNKEVDTQSGSQSQTSGFSTESIKKKFEDFQYIKYYYPRFCLYHLGSCKYLFHPGLIPYLLELPSPAKLKGSVIYTFCEFLGRNIALVLDETIFTKPGSQSDSIYFLVRDIPLFMLIFSVIFLNSVILYSTFSGKLTISRTPSHVFISLAISGIVYGYIITRGTTGSKAIFDYYRRKPGETGLSKTDSSKNVSEILTISYYLSLIFPYFCSKLVQYNLRKKRRSRDYIVTRKYGNLSSDDVISLFNLFSMT